MAGAPVKMRPHVKKIEVIILAVSFSTMLPYHCHAQIAVCDRFAHFSFSTRIRVSLPLWDLSAGHFCSPNAIVPQHGNFFIQILHYVCLFLQVVALYKEWDVIRRCLDRYKYCRASRAPQCVNSFGAGFLTQNMFFLLQYFHMERFLNPNSPSSFKQFLFLSLWGRLLPQTDSVSFHVWWGVCQNLLFIWTGRLSKFKLLIHYM